MTETRHIKLDYGEALNSKKELLSSQINLIYINKKLLAYKALRKKELVEKNKLKLAMTSLRAKMDFLLSTFPKEQSKPMIHKRRKSKTQEEQKNLSEELEDIQKKLAKLS